MDSSAAAVPLNPDGCTPDTCPAACGLEIIDSLLRAPGAIGADAIDRLLDLRWLLQRRENADAALALFCHLRLTLEDRDYLRFYRLRRWFENHIQAQVSLNHGAPEPPIPIRLDNYSLEALRGRCLQSATPPGDTPSDPRVKFLFRPLSGPDQVPIVAKP